MSGVEMRDEILILGSGGHAAVLIDLIRAAECYEIAGIVDPDRDLSESVHGVPVLGDDFADYPRP